MKIARSFNCGFDGDKNLTSPGGAGRMSCNDFVCRPSGLDSLGGAFPQLKLRAIFVCPCRTKHRRHKPLVEKLERFVKFKPQTPLSEIIRRTAK